MSCATSNRPIKDLCRVPPSFPVHSSLPEQVTGGLDKLSTVKCVFFH